MLLGALAGLLIGRVGGAHLAPGCRELGSSERLVAGYGAEEVGDGVFQGLGHELFALTVEEEPGVGDLALALQAEQGCVPDVGLQRLAARSGRGLVQVLLDADAPAEVLADRVGVGVDLELLVVEWFEVGAEGEHGLLG